MKTGDHMSTKIALGTLLALMTGVTAHADAPQAVIITIHVLFYPTGEQEGTFTATLPLCEFGTVRGTGFGVGNRAGHFLGRYEFICGDNSGTFVTQQHPSASEDPSFTFSGRWSFLGSGNTGRYAGMSGHGEFGDVFDFSEEIVVADGTWVGFVQLK
jgi:hypothetical protein